MATYTLVSVATSRAVAQKTSLGVWLARRGPALIAGPTSGQRVLVGPGWTPVYDAAVAERATAVVEAAIGRGEDA